jgi:hypothetical protein
MHFMLWFAIDLPSERGEGASRKAFHSCVSLDVVTFETGSMLGLLKKSAFAYSSLRLICLPNHVTSFGDSSFERCFCLASLA